MKKVFLSALLLTGVMAMAQEKKPTQVTAQPAQTTQTAAPAVKEAKPATTVQAQPAAQVAPAKKTETTVKQEKVEVKKADPAKKSK